MGGEQHNDNVVNINDTNTCSLPSGSYDWKTLLACSDGDSGPTRDISYGDSQGEEKERQEEEKEKNVRDCALQQKKV